jgi:isopentenyl phosphate kinase
MYAPERTASASREVGDAMAELAASVDDAVVSGGAGAVPEPVVQQMFALAVKLYAAQRAAGADFPPVPEGDSVNATEVSVATTALLGAVNLDLFELSLWRHWGRP